MSPRWMAIALAVVIMATLVTDAGVVLARSGDPDTTAAPAPAPAVTEHVPDKLQPVLPELEAFVEQARGLQFKHPPTVALVPDDQFEERLQSGDSSGTGGDQQDPLGVMRAFGLVDADVDVEKVAQTEVSNVIGFYDTQTKELYVRGVDPTPYAEETLVHELTHALDDQHFGLDHPELDAPENSDAMYAYQALVEGDAVTVEKAWHDSRPQVDQDAIASLRGAGGGADDGSTPDAFNMLFSFPYEFGPDFVAALRATGGQTRLDAAFDHPPTTTEQILQPERFLAGEGARQVQAPHAAGEVTDEGSLGELGLFLVTYSAGSYETAVQASIGWAGDSYRAWIKGNQTCIRWSLQMDSPSDTTQVLDVLHDWADKHPGATVSGTDTVEINNCA